MVTGIWPWLVVGWCLGGDAVAARLEGGAVVRGEMVGNELRWHFSGKLDGEAGRLPLLWPIGGGQELGLPAGFAPETNAEGAVVAILAPPGRRQLRIEAVEALPVGTLEGWTPVVLHPPLIGEGQKHRIDLLDLDLRPDAGLGLLTHVQERRAGGFSRAEARALDRQMGEPSREARLGRPIYLYGDENLGALGLSGSVRKAGATSGGLLMGALLLSGLLVGGILTGLRLLRIQARKEEVEAYIQTEFLRPGRAGGNPTEGRGSPGEPPVRPPVGAGGGP
jgi:hypothetical protein